MREVVLGTRGSGLALWQARDVARRLLALHPGLRVAERILRTAGDIDQARPLDGSNVGVFVRRLEEALLEGEIDLAVHSLKDLPTEQPAELCVAAVLERHDPHDVLLSTSGARLEELGPGTVLGTGSLRRRAQILHARPDLRTAPVRGNVETRIGKLTSGSFGGIVLALAGVERLGLERVPYRRIPLAVCLPAVGQGAVAVETRRADERLREVVRPLEHAATRAAVDAERAFLLRLGGGCLAPAAAYGVVEGDRLRLAARAGDCDGIELLHDEEEGPVAAAEAIGARLADRLLAVGAGELLRRSRAAVRPPEPS